MGLTEEDCQHKAVKDLNIFLEEAKKTTKNATFFVLYSAKRICEKYKMAAE
jgi:hypothetical protein